MRKLRPTLAALALGALALAPASAAPSRTKPASLRVVLRIVRGLPWMARIFMGGLSCGMMPQHFTCKGSGLLSEGCFPVFRLERRLS